MTPVIVVYKGRDVARFEDFLPLAQFRKMPPGAIVVRESDRTRLCSQKKTIMHGVIRSDV